MKRFLTLFITVAMLSHFSTPGLADVENSHKPNEIVGELVKLEGAFVTIKDKDGKFHQFQVDTSTRTDGKVKIGSRVQVKSSDNGHALSVQTLQ